MRQKHVFRSDEVPHIWAQQRQDEGRNSQGNFYFKGKTIYSYGSHFPIASFVDPSTVILTTKTYSPTTNRQIWATYRAIDESRVKVFRVPNVPVFDGFDRDTHSNNAEWFLKQFETWRDKAVNGRAHSESYRKTLTETIQTGSMYVERFKKEIDPKLRRAVRKWFSDLEHGKLFTEHQLTLFANQEKRAKAREARDRERLNNLLAGARWKVLADVERWKRGEIDQLSYPSGRVDTGRYAFGRPVYVYGSVDVPTLLRIRGERVETSRGAQITVRTAKLLWAAILAGRDVAGFKLDNYAAAGIINGELVAGCHRIPMTELDRIAAALQLPARPNVKEVRP